MAVISTLIVIVMLVFGGTGATVYAAQSSLPDQPLYSVKLASENVRASLPASRPTRVELALDFADLRLQEALQLAADGKPIPGAVWERMNSHLDLALYTTAGLNDEPLHQQLLQIQARMQTELERLAQLKANGRYSDTAESARGIVLRNLQLVGIGLTDPAAFRRYMQPDQRHPGSQQPTAGPSLTSTAAAQPTRAMPTRTATAQPTQTLPASTATVQPTQAMPTSTATLQPKTAPTQAPKTNPKTNPQGNHSNGHPAGCCCPWCRGGSGGHNGGHGGGHH